MKMHYRCRFSALSGTDKVIAGVDRVSMKINTNQTIDLTSNDVLLGSGSVYNVLSLSTSKVSQEI